MSVTNMGDYRPHISIVTPDGNAHVCPVAMFEDIAAGNLSIDDIDDRDQIIRAVIADWLGGDDGPA